MSQGLELMKLNYKIKQMKQMKLNQKKIKKIIQQQQLKLKIIQLQIQLMKLLKTIPNNKKLKEKENIKQ